MEALFGAAGAEIFFAEGDKSRTGHLRGCFGKAVSCGLSKETGDNARPRRLIERF